METYTCIGENKNVALNTHIKIVHMKNDKRELKCKQ